ncbi:Zinc finger, PHD-type [Corchorus capsularis]|uniref:Zinc finger, PHD-type n=1 Tax=Corchorus capsularis TaxID=210143 RepID=A0A1R3IM55_COCAP|nr:Zinc finger, PHD-type [Corchorus capsularis]
MAFSDDEEETIVSSVSNYYFNDEKDEAVPFSELPLQLGGKETRSNSSKRDITLRGTADDGLLTICKRVTAWKFDLGNVGKPEISVLSKESGWIKLQKPRKSFEPVIRSVLIMVHCLHLLYWNPDLSGKLLWEQLAKVFSSYELKPSQNDLVDHMELIGEAVKSDGSLAKSKFLHSFLEEKPVKKKFDDEKVRATSISGFIVDDGDDAVASCEQEDPDDDDDDDDDELFDSVCAFCDNGGELMCCEGKCMRSFHATEEAGEESSCESLGLTKKQVEAIPTFLCKNCEYNQHQCFVCGKLGSSDKSAGAEVFRCGNATCGRFYHPDCVAKLLHKGDKIAAEEHGKNISAGEFFTCPIHKCCVCQQGENKKVLELQLALCRRCPTSYHRKCLPREIAFEDIDEEGIKTRAWDGLLVNRVLIYCLKHKIRDDILTPERDHVKFPFVKEMKFVADERKKRKASDLPTSHEKVGLKKRNLALEDSLQERTSMKASKQLSCVAKDDQSSKKTDKVAPGTSSLKNVKAGGASKKPLKGMQMGKSSDENKISLGDRLFALMNQESEEVNPGKQDMLRSGPNKPAMAKATAKKLSSEIHSLDADSERRLLAIMKEAESSITLEDITAEQKVPSTTTSLSKGVLDRITRGKIEGSVEAVRMALEKLEAGCSIEEAQAVCEPEVLNQIFKWQNKLKVCLAPFLYGKRYTSFGRHFTKVDKLNEIVDRLHWYVQDGDMIVDFCCGANDFSLLMKKKLEETGKKCSYKNYDIFQTKNDFNLEIRDWMTVQPKELPKGSQLIMGLNPPFGVKAALANKFINKALEFSPKLLILIVPPETERLDRKKNLKFPYELVWEDNQFLSGKSFYLPGSVDTNDKQMDQWNVMAPPLYLWSRSDFSAKHKSIAEKHGHLHRKLFSFNHEGKINETHTSGQPSDNRSQGDDAPELEDHNQDPKTEEHIAASVTLTAAPEECSLHQQGVREGQDNHSNVKSQAEETVLKNVKHSDENHGRGTERKSPVVGQSGGKTPITETYSGIPHSSPSNVMGAKSALECRQEGSAIVTEKEFSPCHQGEKEGQDIRGHVEIQSKEPSKEQMKLSNENPSKKQMKPSKENPSKKQMKPSKENHDRGSAGKCSLDGQSGGRAHISERHGGISHSSPSNVKGAKSSVEGRQEVPVTGGKEFSPPHEGERKRQDTHGHMENQSKETSRKKKLSKEIHDRGLNGKPPLDGHNGRRASTSEKHGGTSHSSGSGRSPVDSFSSKSPKMAARPGIDENVHRHPNPTKRGSQVHPGYSSYNDTRTNISDGMGRRYNINSSQPHPVGAEHFNYRPYSTGVGRESDLREQVRLYGHNPNVSTQRNYVPGLDTAYPPPMGSLSTPPYGHHGAPAGPSYRMNTSATQRYAPRLDELNYTRMGTPGPEPPMGMGYYDPRAPRPPYPMGFAPGPYHPHSHQHSAGWLDD